MKIVTYNLRCVWEGDEKNSFIHRAGLIYEKIQAEKPDIIAFQEVVEKQAEFLERMFPEYWLVGHGRMEDYTGEGLYTAIRKDTCMLAGFEVFWLSPTIYVPASRFEDQSPCPRTCVVSLVRHKETGRMFRIYNVHLDHIGPKARVDGMQCVLDKVKVDEGRGKAEIVVLGDYNEYPDGGAVVLSNEYPLHEVTKDITGTFHNYERRTPIKIDYIFVSDYLKECVQKVEAWKDQKNGIFLSDHYPLCAEFDIQ